MHAQGVSIWVSSLVVGSTVKRWLSHVYGQVFQVFVYLWPIVWFLFPHLTCLKILPNMHVAWIQPRDLWGRPWHHLFLGGTPSFFTPKESFCACAVSPLPPKMGNMTSWSFMLCFCHNCYFTVSTGGKGWLFTLFLLLFLLKCKQEVDCKYLASKSPVSFLRICK